MNHVCYLFIASSELVANWISERLNRFCDLNQFSLLLILRNDFEEEISLKLSTDFLQVSLFVFFWTNKLIELLSQIFVDWFVKLIEFIVQLLLLLLVDDIILGFIIRLKHPNEYNTWGIIMLNRGSIKLQKSVKCIGVVSKFSHDHSKSKHELTDGMFQ